MIFLDTLGHLFLREKFYTFDVYRALSLKVQNDKDTLICHIHSDHGGESENIGLGEFCDNSGITYIFSALYTPQSNGVVECKNINYPRDGKVMLHEINASKSF